MYVGRTNTGIIMVDHYLTFSKILEQKKLVLLYFFRYQIIFSFNKFKARSLVKFLVPKTDVNKMND